MGDLLGGGSTGSSSGGNPLAALGSTLSSLFSGAGNTASSVASGVGNALSTGAGDVGSAITGMSSAQAAQQAFDPTGSISAQATIDPPSAGTAADQQSSIGGTQSGGDTSSGDGTQQKPTQQNQYAPQSAVEGLKQALTSLAQGRQVNPWEPQPQPGLNMAANRLQPPPNLGQPAPQAAAPVLPQLSAGETGPQSEGPSSAEQEGVQQAGRMNAGLPSGGTDPSTVANAPMPPPRPTDAPADGDSPISPTDPAEASTGPQPAPTATPTGPAAPSTVGGKPTPQTDDQGNRIVTVKKKGPAVATQDLPTKTGALPTRKGGPTPAPGNQIIQPGNQILHDVTGGQAMPSALPQLAQAALGMLLPLLMSGVLGGGGGRHGHGRGGFRHFGGFHHGGEGHWPYHHPMQGWQLHGHHPGGGWRPLHPQHLHVMTREHPGGGQEPISQIMQAMLSNNQQAQGNQQQAGNKSDPYSRRTTPDEAAAGDTGPQGTGAGYIKSGNPFTDAVTGIESPNGNVVSRSDEDSQGRTLAQGGDPTEIAQGYFQIQSHRNGGTWQTYAEKAGVDLIKNPNPMRADYETQHKVARMIPFYRWGPQTKAKMHQKFGTFSDRWTLGQLEDHFGKSNVAGVVAPPPTMQSPSAGGYTPSPLG